MSNLLANLVAGKRSTGAWLFMGSPASAEILAHHAFDALIIDLEHSPGTVETAVHQMRAIRAAGQATILVRLGSLDAAAVKLILDCGAEGLLLPNVESADEARDFVAACRYPPRGRRGAHFTVSRAASWGLRSNEYQISESALLLIAMIESTKGVEAIPQIAAVEGIGMLFMGPLDLSGSAGFMGEWERPEVSTLFRRAEASALTAGIAAGTALIPGETLADCFARGLAFVTVGADVGMLKQGATWSLAQSA